MILCDREILKKLHEKAITIDPFVTEQLQPASYDFKLGQHLQVFNRQDHGVIDPYNLPDDLTRLVTMPEGGFYVLHPQEFVLGSSVEWFGFNESIMGQLWGKSSLGRLGLVVHATAGLFDPGFKGTATLELHNVSNQPIKIYPDMRIGQMTWWYLSGRSERVYGDERLGSKYQGQGPEPVASRFDK